LQRAFHAGIAGWLAAVPGPVIFGMDAGPPVLDDADPLLGSKPTHGLHEVLRASHDHMWATSDLEVLDVQCLADEAAAAGSDHALLLADLALRTS
jgi:endonuclease/exonuclease/phosphatase family metal-dependent hydrolase